MRQRGPVKQLDARTHWDDVKSGLAAELYAAREAQAISQNELGQRARISDRLIGDLEGAKLQRPPRPETLAKLSIALGLRPDTLLQIAGLSLNADRLLAIQQGLTGSSAARIDSPRDESNRGHLLRGNENFPFPIDLPKSIDIVHRLETAVQHLSELVVRLERSLGGTRSRGDLLARIERAQENAEYVLSQREGGSRRKVTTRKK